MLRVAALAKIITENWIGEEIPKEDIVNVCLFHDIAKPLTFIPEKQARYGATPEEIENIKKLQSILINKYGGDEHYTTVSICKDEGLSSEAVRIMDAFEWEYMEKFCDNRDIPTMIVLYCDMRIAPKGIEPLTKRLENIKDRYKEKPLEHDKFYKYGSMLESMIKTDTDIDLQTITNEDLIRMFPELLKKCIPS